MIVTVEFLHSLWSTFHSKLVPCVVTGFSQQSLPLSSLLSLRIDRVKLPSHPPAAVCFQSLLAVHRGAVANVVTQGRCSNGVMGTVFQGGLI